MKYTVFISIAATAILTACASGLDSDPRGVAAYDGDPRLGEKTDKICFSGNIDGFSNNGRDSVVLSAGNKDYLVTTSGTCPSLRYAQRIGLDDGGGSCLSSNDILIISENTFAGGNTGIGPDRCFIDEIYEWDKRAKTKSDMSTNE
ncbi:DUF6491 family protein [Robiginitomaculum antarcticum]|uniref:DUF6491 family protein n=1 Tax=Robiginitomaculum antarcticum TaxID=437507 RepID=UPI00036338D6|nr:DUF6491 family protein [Robiginitomaculum antarcticum]